MKQHTHRNRHTPYWMHATALALAMLIAGASPALAQSSAERNMPTDAEIANAVQDRLLLDDGVDGDQINVMVRDGIVSLTGTVDNALAKNRASSVARIVKGVRSVVNRIDVVTAGIDDDRIERDVRSALIVNPRTEIFDVLVDVNDGRVNLGGSVGSWQERELVEMVARGVRGVTEVSNDVAVNTTTARTPAEIRDDVRGALRWDRYVDDDLIDIAVDDGTVTLSGAVGSAAERTRAITDAWVRGVNDVQAEDLTVEFWASRDAVRRTQYVEKSDDAIKEAIEDALLRDPRVLAGNVDVSVDEGVATLRGSVDYLAAKSAATQVARDTVGVHWVHDRLSVRPVKAWSDDELARRVESAWLRDPYVEMFELEATVNNGTLRIEGTVDTTFERARAEQIAYDVPGVTEVSNNIAVVTDTTLWYSPYVDDPYPYEFGWYSPSSVSVKSDRRIEQEIEDELWWSPFVDSDRVNVSVDDGVATLTGTADDWGDRQAATENALQGGAVKVINELSIDYGS